MKKRYRVMFFVACFFLGLALVGQVLFWGGWNLLDGAFRAVDTEAVFGAILLSFFLLFLFLVWLIVNTVAPLICFIILCCIVGRLDRSFRIASIVLMIISGIMSLIQIYFFPTIVDVLF